MKTMQEIAQEFADRLEQSKKEVVDDRTSTGDLRFTRTINGFIGERYFDVYFMEDEGNKSVKISQGTECYRAVKKVILSIEPNIYITRD